MSKYTTEVRYVCESYAGLTESGDYTDINDIIANSEDKIFEEYPIFDENYRSVLNTKILRHYYMREICAETVGLWKLYLNNTMNEIMPYYNQLYESALIKFNPMYDVDVSTTHVGNETGENENTNNSNKVSSNSESVKNNENFSGVDSANKSNTRTNDVNKNENISDNKNRSNVKDESVNDSEINTHTTEQKTDNSKEITENSIEINNNKIDENSDRSINSDENNITSSRNTNKFSDTPQGGMNAMDVVNNMYLTNATLNDNDENNIKSKRDNENNNKEINEELNKNLNKSNTENTTTTDSVINSDVINKEQKTDNTETTTEINATNKDYNENANENISSSEISNSEQKRTNETDRVNVLSENNNGMSSNNYHNLKEYTERVAGKRGGVSYSNMLNEFRSTFLNIDMMIIKALEDLFFKLY